VLAGPMTSMFCLGSPKLRLQCREVRITHAAIVDPPFPRNPGCGDPEGLN